jgi:hypothetical protein
VSTPSTTPRKQRNEKRREILKQVKSKDKELETRMAPRAVTAGKCGAKTRGKDSHKICQKPAGWGTGHPGFGRCKYHGGATQSHHLAAYKADAIFMGAEKDINPFDAIMWCIRIKAGEVEWLSQKMQELDQKDWIEESIFGKQMHLWQRERTAAIELLARISKDAVALGIAERSVRLAESYGASIARLLKGIHDDLQLTTAQKNMWPQIVRRQLILIETTQTIGVGAPNQVIEGRKAS